MAEQRLGVRPLSRVRCRPGALVYGGGGSSELLDKSAQTCGTRLPISMLEDSPPVYLADLAWGMYTNTSKAPQQDKCFHRVVFIETSRYRPAVCYMSRRLRKDRVRYWTKELEGKVEGDLRAWADRNKNVLDYDVQEFADKVPLHLQVERAGRCDILFGPHGAGLAHEFWLRPGSHEFDHT